MADENPSYYWKFIDELNQLRPALNRLDTDAKQYRTALRLAKSLLGESQTELLKLSLSLRSLSPRVQAHLQIARDVLESNGPCSSDAFAVIGGKVVCAPGDVESEISRQVEMQKTKSDKEEKVDLLMQQFPFDNLFPGSESHPVTVILYNEIGSESSRQFHELLQEAAMKGTVKLINRHYVKNQVNKKVRLSGYGVELQMKSTEYKSQDDSPKQADDETAAEATESGDSEVNGFDFAVLK